MAIRGRRWHGYETARPDVANHVPTSARRILELGCSTGALGAALKQRQPALVVGVERRVHVVGFGHNADPMDEAR